MTAPAAAIRVLWLVVYAASLVVAAWHVRVRFLWGWSGALARLAELIIGIALMTVPAELLGAVGLFRRVPLVVASVVIAVAAVLVARRPATLPTPPPVRAPTLAERRPARVAAAFAVAIVAALWFGHVATSLSSGVTDVDSLHYHLPFAARFAQLGWVTRLHFTRASAPITQFHPASAELLHGIGIAGLSRDVATPVINTAWLIVAFLAAWCIGRVRGVGSACIAAVAVVAVAPVIVVTQAGTGENDIVTIALLVSAVALPLASRRQDNGMLIAGAAIGLAAGTKLTMLVPAAVLAVAGVVLLVRSGRTRATIGFASVVAATGGFWYIRNLVRAGSPVPSAHLAVGPVGFPSPPLGVVDRYGFSVAHYATNAHVWRHSFLPGLRLALGPAWPAIIALAVVGVVLVVWRGASTERIVAVAAASAAVTYVLTPTTAGGREGAPLVFAPNLRYLTPAVCLALVLLPLAEPVRRWELRWSAVSVALLAVVIVTVVAASGWPVWLSAYRAAAIACALVVGVGVAVALMRADLLAPLAGAIAICVGAVGVTGLFVDLRRRDSSRHRATAAALGAVGAWAGTQHDARIAIDGFFVQYPLYGDNLSNYVQYLGARIPHGGFAELPTCRAWWTALARGGYQYAVVAPSTTSTAALEDPRRVGLVSSWMAGDPRAQLVLHAGAASVYRIDPDAPAPATCT